jgi:hypothetical protein
MLRDAWVAACRMLRQFAKWGGHAAPVPAGGAWGTFTGAGTLGLAAGAGGARRGRIADDDQVLRLARTVCSSLMQVRHAPHLDKGVVDYGFVSQAAPSP